MRLSGRLSAAIEVLDDMERHHRPVAQALKDWGLSHRFAGAADRAAIGTIVYDALRRRTSLAWRMDDDSPAALAYGALFAIITPARDVSSLLEDLMSDPFAPPPLAAACLQAWQNREGHEASDDIQADIPSWCHDMFRNLYGADWLTQAHALRARPPLDLRLNRLKVSFEKLGRALDEYEAHALSWFEMAWRIAPTTGFGRHPNLQASTAFQKGWFEIQDLGSQIVAHLAEGKPNIQILDYCAGGGGKTLALAVAMENRGQIYAHDHDKARLAPIFARLQRAGVRNAQILEKPSSLDKLHSKMDLVLVDAPCSGSGTWRRHPDAKWRLRQAQLHRRVEEQCHILERAKHLVRPGGRLAYITCSLFDVENDHQIADFLRQNGTFQPVDMQAHWHKLMPATAPLPHFGTFGLTLSPATNLSDGFYIALIERHH